MMRKAPQHKAIRAFLQAGAFVLVVGIAFFLSKNASESEAIRSLVGQYGYFGILVIAAISGINLAVPIPAIAFLPLFLESGLNYWATIVFISFGMTLGDSIAYLLGRAGRTFVESGLQKKINNRLEVLRTRYHYAPLAALFFFAAFVPLPNELIVVPLSFFGYRFLHMMVPVFAGNILFNILYSYGVIGFFETL